MHKQTRIGGFLPFDVSHLFRLRPVPKPHRADTITYWTINCQQPLFLSHLSSPVRNASSDRYPGRGRKGGGSIDRSNRRISKRDPPVGSPDNERRKPSLSLSLYVSVTPSLDAHTAVFLPRKPTIVNGHRQRPVFYLIANPFGQ